MKRRDFLTYTGSLSSFIIIDAAATQFFWIPSASGATIPLESLRQALNPGEALILVPGEKQYQETQVAINKRHENIKPQVRVLCRTEEAVSVCIQWAKINNVPMAMRSGGHSYEGLSLSPGLVIDIRMMDDLQLASDASTITVGGGALLGKIYETVAKKSVVIPAGTCPTVGVTGHTTGGGYGLLARPFGLACDSLLSAQMVDVNGSLLNINEDENKDLFWAIRGGGSGSFGVLTQLKFKTHSIGKVTTFVVRWKTDVPGAAHILKLWQDWAPQAPQGITSLLNCRVNKTQIQLSLVGQTINKVDALKNEIKTHFTNNIKTPAVLNKIETKSFIEAVKQFSGNNDSFYIKGKSDYVKAAHDSQAREDIFNKMPTGVAVIFDSYGGQITAKKDVETAFAHRENTICSIQYYMQWEKASETAERLKIMQDYYQSLRPHMSGSAYFNYCDLDLGSNYATAYWGKNLSQLVNVKNTYDPDNFFKHAQSIPTQK